MRRIGCWLCAFTLLMSGCSGMLPGFPGLSGVVKTGSTAPALDLPIDGNSQVDLRVANTFGSNASSCELRNVREAAARQLIVMIKVSYEKKAVDSVIGSGIVFSTALGKLYVVTARHVLDSQPLAGRPKITISLPGQAGDLPGVRSKGFQEMPNDDVAVVEADLKTGGPQAARYNPRFDVLRAQDDAFKDDKYVAIGYPAARAQTVSEAGSGKFDGNLLRLSSTIEGGNSGGGVFDSYRRLAGMVTQDASRFGSAYPIAYVIQKLRLSKLPVDLKLAPAPALGVYVDRVEGNPASLSEPVREAVFRAMKKEGLEPGCLLPDAYTAFLNTKSVRSSGTTTTLEISGSLKTPNGGVTEIQPATITALSLPQQDPFSDPEKLRRKADEAAVILVRDLKKRIGVGSTVTNKAQ